MLQFSSPSDISMKRRLLRFVRLRETLMPSNTVVNELLVLCCFWTRRICSSFDHDFLHRVYQ